MKRSEAKAKGLTRYFTGNPCPSGHIAERITSGGQCVVCNAARAKAWQDANRDKTKETDRAYKDANRDRIKTYRRAYYQDNIESERERKRLHMRGRHHIYKRKLQAATPKWLSNADSDAIMAIYVEARATTETTGVPHEVDHIVPIIGKNVCGLHVPWNLRVITQFENRSKGNRHD
jgi:hypothetical protein